MGSRWFYKAAGQSAGPVSSRQLRELADAAIVELQESHFEVFEGPWFAAAKIKGLFPQEAGDSAGGPNEQLKSAERNSGSLARLRRLNSPLRLPGLA